MSPRWRQVAVLASGTWRLAWREPLTRLLLALALALAVAGSVAAVGSPTAGDGAIQMLAVCLQLVPFATVLLAGDIWRQDTEDVAVLSRPLDAAVLVGGRAAGLCLVGLGLIGAVGLVSLLGLWLVAGLNLAASAAWLGVFCAVYVAPGLVLLAGACLCYLAGGGAGPRYHAAAVVATLAVAFYSYKLQAIASAHLHTLAFFAPFPGFLTLGLALPPGLLGAPAVPGWLWWNRGLCLAAGLLLLVWAVHRRSRAFPAVPLRSRSGLRTALTATAGAALAAGVVLAVMGGRLAPPVLAVRPPIRTPPGIQATSLRLTVAADAATGHLTGQADWSLAGGAGRPVVFLLDAGLRPTTGSGMRPLGGRALVPGTAARLWEAVVPPGGMLALRFAGTLLPVPSSLPYPPFPVGQNPAGAALGRGRAFWNGDGTWYPVLLGTSATLSPGRVRLHLTIRGGRGRWLGLPAQRGGNGLTLDWSGARLPAVIGVLGPYRSFSGSGWQLWAGAAPSPRQRQVLTTYAQASGGPLTFALSPLQTKPRWADGILWLPGDQPFCAPPDPVTGSCRGVAPTPAAAAAVLRRLGLPVR